jgi:diguanylate cyclase (GGDEF)-like protein/PAS domain S-box-containing protein
MTLRKRLLWLFTPLLALTLVIAYGLSERILLSRFDQQDQTLLLNDLERLQGRLDTHLKRSIDLLRTYSEWDDSYEFMQGKQPDFVRRNMDKKSLDLLNFDFMIYLDLNGQAAAQQWQLPVAAELLSAEPSKPHNYQALRSEIMRLGQQLAKQATFASNDNHHAQVLLIQGTPVLLVASPISTTQNYVAPIGTLLAGHIIDAARFKSLLSLVDGNVQLTQASDATLNWHLLDLPSNSSLSELRSSPRRLLDNQHQQIDLQVSNQLQQPPLVLRINKQRHVRTEGQQAIGFFLLLTVTVGVLALLLIYLSLEFWVLRRLQLIHREVTLIGPDSELPQLTDQGDDELGQLARGLNKMFARLNQSETREQLILDSINEGYFEVDLNGNLISANKALGRFFGYNAQELQERDIVQIVSADNGENARSLLTQLATGGQSNMLAAQFKHRDGSLGHFEARLAPINDPQGKNIGWRGVLRDTTEQMTYQNQLLDMAYRDSLTGLGNRKAFNEQLHSNLTLMRSKRQPLALLYIDLDHFKPVNDRYGHDVGDLLLKNIAERMRNALRQPDWAYRLGGDEFTIILPDADQQSALKLAERLISRISQPFKYRQTLIDFVTPSIGIAFYPEHAQDAEGLIKAADIAMYEAKQQRNRAQIYQPSPHSPTSEATNTARDPMDPLA